MFILQYDKDKHAASVEHLSGINKEREDLAMVMTETWQNRKKEKWTDAQFMEHRCNADRHQYLVNEILMAESTVKQYEELSPKAKRTESETMVDPMVRWGMWGHSVKSPVLATYSMRKNRRSSCRIQDLWHPR